MGESNFDYDAGMKWHEYVVRILHLLRRHQVWRSCTCEEVNLCLLLQCKIFFAGSPWIREISQWSVGKRCFQDPENITNKYWLTSFVYLLCNLLEWQSWKLAEGCFELHIPRFVWEPWQIYIQALEARLSSCCSNILVNTWNQRITC